MLLYCVGCKHKVECSGATHTKVNGRVMVKAKCAKGHSVCSFRGMKDGEGLLDVFKPLAKKAAEAALEAAKKKAPELAKAAGEALANKAADAIKEKIKPKTAGKGKGKGY